MWWLLALQNYFFSPLWGLLLNCRRRGRDLAACCRWPPWRGRLARAYCPSLLSHGGTFRVLSLHGGLSIQGWNEPFDLSRPQGTCSGSFSVSPNPQKSLQGISHKHHARHYMDCFILSAFKRCAHPKVSRDRLWWQLGCVSRSCCKFKSSDDFYRARFN